MRPAGVPEPRSDYTPGGRPLGGAKVLAIFMGLFAIVLAANGTMTYFALKTFSGEVTKHPYERGLAYNRDIAAARAQMARGWTADVRIEHGAGRRNEIRVRMRDANGQLLPGLKMEALFAAPADLARDIRIGLDESAPGDYAGLAQLPAGQRDLILTAARDGGEIFRSHNRVNVE